MNPETKTKLSDPAYFALHLQAAMAIRHVAQFGWYDSHFLRRLAVAKHYLGNVRPDVLCVFSDGFVPLLPDPDYSVQVMDDVFDQATAARIVEASRTAVAERSNNQDFENAEFGRDVIWDHPLFSALQADLTPALSELAGRPLAPSYSFLSRYGSSGICDPHMDHPDSLFTFDYCIEQSEEWPIYFSKVVDWPSAQTVQQLDLSRIKDDPSFEWTPYTLRPNQALLFNGSSQWHYRNAISPGGFCHLLFFHFIPTGCEDLVLPKMWAAHFGIPELEPLCDLFHRNDVDDLA